MIEFTEFPKIPRFMRSITITEKIDGTNGQIYIFSPAEFPDLHMDIFLLSGGIDLGDRLMVVGSRNRWIGPGKMDNSGFWAWVNKNKEELGKLGYGRHFGEWWGQGIQRGYGLTEKRFSLFNVSKWTSEFNIDNLALEHRSTVCIECSACHVAPKLGEYPAPSTSIIGETLNGILGGIGSFAAPGFFKPEGIMIYHQHANQYFKYTFDDQHKG